MISKKSLLWVSFTLLPLGALSVAIGIYLHAAHQTAPLAWEGTPKPRPKAVSAFLQPKLTYEEIKSTLLSLTFVPPALQLPDLSKLLTYLGPNGRPDISQSTHAVYFALANCKEQAAISPGEKLYLLFNRKERPGRYQFSPGNSPTNLWLEVEPEEGKSVVTVQMTSREGELIQSPPERQRLALEQKELPRSPRQESWMLAGHRVDGTLLARQKAKWFGKDRFLERHGGDEFLSLAAKERIDFGEGEDVYSIYASEGDIFIYENGRWRAVDCGPESLGKPLLHVKKIAERILTFDLWNGEGSTKVPLNLLKINDRWTVEQLQREFRFVATKTRSQYVFEVGDTKMTLAPQDWLVKTEEGWEKLETAEEIDAYVDRKLKGPLFVFDGFVKKEDKQVLIGTLFNSARTEYESIELDVPQSSVTVLSLPKRGNEIITGEMIDDRNIGDN